METNQNQELIDLSGIARITGRKMPTISNWRKRDATFPKPVGGSELRPLFALPEVEAWIQETGKKVDVKGRDVAFRLLNMLRGRYPTGEIPRVLMPALALTHWAHTNLPNYQAGLSEPHGLRRLVHACRESLVQETPLVVEAITAWVDDYARNTDEVYLVDLLHVMAQADDLAGVARDTTALALKDPRAGYGEHFATPGFSEFLLSILPGGECSYADFGFGGGQNLLTAAERDCDLELHGVEINKSISWYAACFLYLHGVGAQLHTGDLFEWAPTKEFDRITVHAPFGQRLRPRDVEGRMWPFGKPPLSRGDTAWLQLAYQALADGGIAAVAVAPGVLYRGGIERAIMQRMVAQGAVEAVISLPARTQLNTGIPISIVLLRRDKEGMPGEVLMIDVSEFAQGSEKYARGKRDFRLAFSTATAAVERWRTSGDGSSRVSVAVPIADLMAPDANLMPQRWVTSMTEMTVEDVEKTISSVHAAAAEFGTATRSWPSIPELVSVRHAEDEFPLRPLPELGLEILQGNYITSKTRTDDTTLKTTRVITPRSIRTGTPEVLPDMSERKANARVSTKLGDVLVTTAGSRIEAVVCPEAGLEVDRNVSIVRGLGNAWDADFVAHQLVAGHNQAMRTGATVMRVDVKQLLLPHLPIDIQQELGQVIRKFTAFTMTARQAADRAEAYIDSLRNAVSTGRIEVDHWNRASE